MLVVFLVDRPGARSARGAVAADRQAGARVRARAAAPAGADARHRRHEGQGVAAERVGVVVRVVPRRASAAGASSRRRTSCRSSASTTRTSATTGSRGSRSTAIRTRCRSSTATAASASTGASTACPRRSSSTSRASIRYKQIGPVTRRSAGAEDPAAGARAAEVMKRTLRWLMALGALVPSSRVGARAVDRRRVARRAPEASRDRAALPRLPEPVARRLERGARRGPAPRGARARARPARATPRSRSTWSRATATSCSTARRSRARRGCCGSGPSCCSRPARSIWYAVVRGVAGTRRCAPRCLRAFRRGRGAGAAGRLRGALNVRVQARAADDSTSRTRETIALSIYAAEATLPCCAKSPRKPRQAKATEPKQGRAPGEASNAAWRGLSRGLCQVISGDTTLEPRFLSVSVAFAVCISSPVNRAPRWAQRDRSGARPPR